MKSHRTIRAVTSIALAAVASPIGAQEMAGMQDTAVSITVGASAIPVGTIASPGVSGRTLAEGYITQPMLMGMLVTPRERFKADLTIDLEGITLKRGELNAGVYGEGYVDRRHPHTYLHELVGTGTFGGGMSRFSVTVGKGFVPFGTDDPMSRPFVKYPVNHHLAQILERAMIIAAASNGPLAIEVSKFGGDEPEGPSDMPNWDRFGDSWSARFTVRSATGFEAQASTAFVTSPEQPFGGGLDHRKQSVSFRFEREAAYGLAEWARTREMEGDNTAYTFSSLLAEGSLKRSFVTLGLRGELTERPEEERTANAFRTPRPHSDLSIIGRTRWHVITANIAATIPSWRGLKVAPFVEVSTQGPHAILQPSGFDPRSFYGASRLWSYSLGARLGFGMQHSRMGRYGVGVAPMKRGMDHNMEDM